MRRLEVDTGEWRIWMTVWVVVGGVIAGVVATMFWWIVDRMR